MLLSLSLSLQPLVLDPLSPGLVILRKVEVLPKQGLPPLLAVYTMCLPPDAPQFRTLLTQHPNLRRITARLHGEVCQGLRPYSSFILFWE